MMRKRIALFTLVLIGIFLSFVGMEKLYAKTYPNPMPQGGEVAFVSGIQLDLEKRFATIAQAEAAGYFRYTNEDDTGSISYANLAWTSHDATQPSQLWYDVHGNLLGADFSVPYTKGMRPKLWGVNPERWDHFPKHVHYVLRDDHGSTMYHGISIKKFLAAGGNETAPVAATLVKMGLAKDADDVARVFVFPNIWDLMVWIKPNPAGAFADKNPLVKPSANAEKGDGM